MSSVAEDKESLQNYQKQCEGDVKSLRNLTLDVINSIKGKIYTNIFSILTLSNLFLKVAPLQGQIVIHYLVNTKKQETTAILYILY